MSESNTVFQNLLFLKTPNNIFFRKQCWTLLANISGCSMGKEERRWVDTCNSELHHNWPGGIPGQQDTGGNLSSWQSVEQVQSRSRRPDWAGVRRRKGTSGQVSCRVPIPACIESHGGFYNPTAECSKVREPTWAYLNLPEPLGHLLQIKTTWDWIKPAEILAAGHPVRAPGPWPGGLWDKLGRLRDTWVPLDPHGPGQCLLLSCPQLCSC